MKNLRIPKTLFTILLTSFLLTTQSCKDVTNDLSPEKSTPVSERVSAIGDPYKYTLDNLTMIGKGVLSASTNTNFRKMVYTEIDKKFDGDFNVLVNTLGENASKMNINLVQNVAKSMGNASDMMADAQNVMNAFKNIESNEYYPQVYIPFFKELKKSGKIGISNPTIVIFNGNSKNSKENGAPGYVINNEGKIKQIANVKEDYVKNNEVWVISLNERTVSTPQGMKLKKELVSDSKSPSKASRVASTNLWEWQFSTMKILVDKDNNIFMGDSEVCMKAFIDSNVNGNFALNTPYSIYGGYLDLGSFEVGVGKSDNKEFITSHKSTNYFRWGTTLGDNANNVAQTMYYVIYEDDNWPAVQRTATLNKVGGGTVEIQYRSEDLFYDSNTLYSSNGPRWANGYTISLPFFNILVYGVNYINSDIEYGIRVKP